MKTHILSGTFSIQYLGGSDKVHLFQQQPALQQHLLLNSYEVTGHSPSKSEGPDKRVLPENIFYLVWYGISHGQSRVVNH